VVWVVLLDGEAMSYMCLIWRWAERFPSYLASILFSTINYYVWLWVCLCKFECIPYNLLELSLTIANCHRRLFEAEPAPPIPLVTTTSVFPSPTSPWVLSWRCWRRGERTLAVQSWCPAISLAVVSYFICCQFCVYHVALMKILDLPQRLQRRRFK
jgi:hypothetical protein